MSIIRKKEHNPERTARRFRFTMILLAVMLAVVAIANIFRDDSAEKTETKSPVETAMDTQLDSLLANLQTPVGLRLTNARPIETVYEDDEESTAIADELLRLGIELQYAHMNPDLDSTAVRSMIRRRDDLLERQQEHRKEQKILHVRRIFLEDAAGKGYTAFQTLDETLFDGRIVGTTETKDPDTIVNDKEQ